MAEQSQANDIDEFIRETLAIMTAKFPEAQFALFAVTDMQDGNTEVSCAANILVDDLKSMITEYLGTGETISLQAEKDRAN